MLHLVLRVRSLTKFDGDPSLYRRTIGALQYYTLTRPNISYSVNQLSFLHCPTTAHFTATKKALIYLKGTADYGLLFTAGPLNAYCDSNWARDPIHRRSTSGYCGDPVFFFFFWNQITTITYIHS